MEIREARESDLPRLLEIYNEYIEKTPITFDLAPLTLVERKRWFDDFAVEEPAGRHRLYVVESTRGVEGYASSRAFRAKAAYRRSVETSIYLASDATGAGLGSALYTHLLRGLELNSSVHRAYAGITLPNAASVGLHQRLGFKKLAVFSEVGFKFGRYWDVAWFERAL